MMCMEMGAITNAAPCAEVASPVVIVAATAVVNTSLSVRNPASRSRELMSKRSE